MSRADKIQKLSNAIRRYRGLTRGQHFVYSPQRNARQRIGQLLCELGLSLANMDVIDSFKTIDEFNVWLKAI